MKHVVAGLGMLLAANIAFAQTPAPVADAVPSLPVAPPPTPAEVSAAKAKMAEQEKEIARQRDQADATAKAQEREAEKQRKAADEAAEKAAAAEKARTEAAAASAAAAAAAPAAAPTGDARDVATQVCLAEAKSRAMAVGAKNVTMREVKDTDKKSDGRASVTASVNVVTMSSSGKIKTSKKNIKCDTRNGTVTKFKWD